MRRARDSLVVLLLALGAVLWLALSVYPFDYGIVESLVLAGAFVLAGLYQTVLDDALVGE